MIYFPFRIYLIALMDRSNWDETGFAEKINICIPGVKIFPVDSDKKETAVA
jgi:hypothetical protein